jgi:hypothetical protein
MHNDPLAELRSVAAREARGPKLLAFCHASSVELPRSLNLGWGVPEVKARGAAN